MKCSAIVDHYKKHFKPENYGYANAIKAGPLRLTGQRLAVEIPPVSFSEPFTAFSCDSASGLIAQELTRAGITCGIAKLNLPVIADNEQGSIVHKICLANEDNHTFIIGLATPLDQFLGLYPFKELATVSWTLRGLDRQAVNPFVTRPNAVVQEIPSWDLGGIDPMIKPLLAKTIGRNLGLVELGLGLQQRTFYVALVARIISLDSTRSSAVLEWNQNTYLALPLRHLQEIAKGIEHFGADRQSLLRGLKDNNWSFSEEITNPVLRESGEALINEAWPTITAFFAQLPVAEIVQLGKMV